MQGYWSQLLFWLVLTQQDCRLAVGSLYMRVDGFFRQLSVSSLVGNSGNGLHLAVHVLSGRSTCVGYMSIEAP